MGILMGWLIFAAIVGAVGSDRTVGFWGGFFWSVILSPIIGLIIVLCSKSKAQKRLEEQVLYNQQQQTRVLQNMQQPRSHSPASVADELAKLKIQLDQGIITEAEFQQLKSRLVAGEEIPTITAPSTAVAISRTEKKTSGPSTIVIAIIAFVVILFVIVVANRVNDNEKPLPGETQTQVASTQFIDPAIRQTPLIDIRKLIGKSPKEVHQLLGKPVKHNSNKKDCGLNNCDFEEEFQNRNITVDFRNNQALWFEFDNLHNYKFTNLPEIFGLISDQPTDVSERYVWYRDYPGIKNIAFVPSKSDNTVLDYAIVEAE